MGVVVLGIDDDSVVDMVDGAFEVLNDVAIVTLLEKKVLTGG